MPVVDTQDPLGWRIYYASRSVTGTSYTSYIIVEPKNPFNVLYEHDKPIIELGVPGSFDDCGIMPTSIVSNGNIKHLYYIGWTQRKTVPYHNSVGLAISYDFGRSFNKFEGPLLPQTLHEPFFTGTAYVFKNENIWHMWYLSCTGWERINNKMEPSYHIKYCSSDDGINWERNGHVAIDYKDQEEKAICGASVILADKYYMWYCYRGNNQYREKKHNGYKIGFANSNDGFIWERLDNDVGICLSEYGWDSLMMAYPCVIKHNNILYMFYNGNHFGKNGFGYATTI